MRIHACFLDSECNSVLTGRRLWRLHVHSHRLGHVTLGERQQVWLPWLGTLPRSWWGLWWITYSPPSRREKRGWLIRRFPYLYN